MTRLLFLCFGVFWQLPLLSQIELQGMVIDVTGEPLVGVTILNPNNEKGTFSDLDGQFIWIDSSDIFELQLSYTGYLPLQIKIDSSQERVFMLKEDTTQIVYMWPTDCFFYLRYLDIGPSLGALNGTYGVKTTATLPYLGNQRLFLIGSLDWRKGKGSNEYLNISLHRFDLFSLHFGNHYGNYYSNAFKFSLSGEVSKIGLPVSESNSLHQRLLRCEITYRKSAIGLGVIQQRLEKRETALHLKLYQTLPYGFLINGGIDFFNKKQYTLELQRKIPATKLTVTAGYLKNEAFEELSLWVRHRFNY